MNLNPVARRPGALLAPLAMLAVALVVVIGSGAPGGRTLPSAAPPSVTLLTPTDPNVLSTRRPSVSPGPSIPDPVDRIQGQLFGMAGHLMWRSETEAVAQLDMLKEDRLLVVRFDVSWRNSEPSPGQYTFIDKLDFVIDAARARGIQVIITVLETPDWANAGRGPWVPPDDPATYARFVGMLAHRYAGQVLGWEVWNEADLRLFWSPEPDVRSYVRLLLAASAAIRAADPSVVVVAAGPTFGNMGFLEGMYDNGAKGSFDAIAVHPYTVRHAPDDTTDRFHSLTAILDDAHATLEKRGDPDIPIWITEFGWAVRGTTAITERQRAQYSVRTVELIRERPWVQVATLYAIDTADIARRGLSSNGVRSSSWIAYAKAVNKP